MKNSKWIWVGVLGFVALAFVATFTWNHNQHEAQVTEASSSHDSIDNFWQKNKDNDGNRNTISFFTGSWTNWYSKPFQRAILDLAVMRHELFHHNLHDTYLSPEQVKCTPTSYHFRTADGTCTDPNDKTMGSAGVRMGRNVVPSALLPETEQELLTPNPNQVSSVLLTRTEFKPIGFLNLLAASWIQFMIHDWFNHIPKRPLNTDTIEIPSFGDRSALIVPRTPFETSGTPNDATGKPMKAFVNENTHWWDGSQIYGSSQVVQDQVRDKSKGRGYLKLAGNSLLPTSEFDDTSMGSVRKEVTGFNRNWWVGLDMFHTLFTMEHNRIADMLYNKYHGQSGWDEERFFQTARLINVAIMAKIHTVEWTPAILKNPTLKKAMKMNWYGLVNNTGKVDPAFKVIFELPPFGPALRPILGGLVGGAQDLYDERYNLTEEFTSVYRLHSLLPDNISLYKLGISGALPNQSLALEDTREEKAAGLMESIKLKDLLYTFGNNHPGQITLNNFPKTLQNVKLPMFGNFDVAAIDIFRDRERGVPRYNQFRMGIGLRRVASFEDLTGNDKNLVAKLKSVYGSDPGAIDRMDLLVGTLGEASVHRPTGFGFGETQFQIFILMASRRLIADPFFTTYYNASVYTQEGLDYIDKSSLKSVISNHFPELAPHIPDDDGPSSDVNGFSPWSEKSVYKSANQ